MKIVYVVNVPSLTVAGARQLVAGYDEELSGEGNGILADMVSGEDVIMVLHGGDGPSYNVLVDVMED